MSQSLSTATEQLQLFDEATTVVVERQPRRRRRISRRVALTIFALGLATAGMIAGSFAAWTTQSSNPSNSVTTGTLTMTNDRSGTYVFQANNIVPGQTGSGVVNITNSGSIPMAAKLTQDSVSSSGIEANLGLKIHDDTRDWCYWPTNTAGPCASYGAWNATAAVTNLALLSTSGAAKWPAAEAHAFTISWQLAASSPNSDQGKTGSFRLVWDGTQ